MSTTDFQHLQPLRCPPVHLAHNVRIDDDSDNWLRWGTLIAQIVAMPSGKRPNTVGELRSLMANFVNQATGKVEPITGPVQGGDARSIHWEQYKNWDGNDQHMLTIPLPTPDMLDRDVRLLKDIALRTQGCRPYPLPLFYSAIFGGKPRVDFNEQQLLEMGLRRLGEYVINECM